MDGKPSHNNDNFFLIKDCYCCEHFEPQKNILVPMKECWYCKWSDFRKDVSAPKESICHYYDDNEQEK